MQYLFPKANLELNKKFKNKKEVCPDCKGFGKIELISARAINVNCYKCYGKGVLS